MARAKLTLKLPFLGLNRSKRDEFARLQALNTATANWILLLPEDQRAALTTRHLSDFELASAWLNQTIRNARARTRVKAFKALPLETNNQNWTLRKVGDTYSVSFNLTKGARKRIPLSIHPSKHAATLDKIIAGEAKPGTLKLWRSRKGIWYAVLSVSMDVPEPKRTDRFLGVDRGQRHLAVASLPGGLAKFFTFGEIKEVRRRYAALRKKLQEQGKQRAIKKLESRERRIVSHINHIISERLVKLAKDFDCGIRLEDLTGIRRNGKQRKKTKSDAGKNRDYWPYYDLECKIISKALLAGVPAEKHPGAWTSKSCSRCGALGVRTNEHFYCPRCGHQDHADVNAGFNIGGYVGLVCPVEPWKGGGVMPSLVQSGGVDGSPLDSVNAQRIVAN